MDLQRLMDSFSKGMRDTRKDYHITLGGLIKILEGVDKNKVVIFSTGENVGNENSYRGYYSDLSFDIGSKNKTVGELLKQAKKALNSTYQGYKGGDFVMDEDTPLWMAEYGSCGTAIVGHINDEKLVLVCKEID